ncbi:conserved hypothetical protein [Pseudomonas chlororaphis]
MSHGPVPKRNRRNDNVGALADKPGCNCVNDREVQESQGLLAEYGQNPAAILSFSFNKATPPDFAPWRQLPRLTIGALHCTGTVSGGIFRGYPRDI